MEGVSLSYSFGVCCAVIGSQSCMMVVVLAVDGDGLLALCSVYLNDCFHVFNFWVNGVDLYLTERLSILFSTHKY
jgi:hypothetical protein